MLCNVIPAGIQFVKLECWSTFIQFINLRFLGICNYQSPSRQHQYANFREHTE